MEREPRPGKWNKLGRDQTNGTISNKWNKTVPVSRNKTVELARIKGGRVIEQVEQNSNNVT